MCVVSEIDWPKSPFLFFKKKIRIFGAGVKIVLLRNCVIKFFFMLHLSVLSSGIKIPMCLTSHRCDPVAIDQDMDAPLVWHHALERQLNGELKIYVAMLGMVHSM